MGKVLEKARRAVLRRTNQAALIKHLEINCDHPGEVRLYGRVDFGSEPWIITLGRNVHLTDGVKFITHDGGTLLFRQYVPDLEITKPIILGNNVYVGNNVLLLPGVTLGDNVVIGAGAVVTKNVPSGEVWAGVPAKKVKSSQEYFDKIKMESLHLGHLKGKEKDLALREYYGRS